MIRTVYKIVRGRQNTRWADRSNVKHALQNTQNDCYQRLSGSSRAHQIHFRPGLRPGPRWGSLQRSTESLDLRGPTSNADGRRSKFLVQETRKRILVQEICPCVTVLVRVFSRTRNLDATCIHISCTKFLVRVSRTRNLDRLSSAWIRWLQSLLVSVDSRHLDVITRSGKSRWQFVDECCKCSTSSSPPVNVALVTKPSVWTADNQYSSVFYRAIGPVASVGTAEVWAPITATVDFILPLSAKTGLEHLAQ